LVPLERSGHVLEVVDAEQRILSRIRELNAKGLTATLRPN